MELWKCPPASIKTFGTSQWWCGIPWVTLPCTGDDSHFFNIPSGAFVKALAASAPSSAVDTLTRPNTPSSTSSNQTSTNAAPPKSTTKGAASTDHVSTNAAPSDQGQPRSSKMPTALGAGIGSGFGIITIGSLMYLYTRRTKSKHDTTSSHESGVKESDDDTSPMELRDTERPHELDDNGKTEMPGTGAKIVPDI